MLEQRKRGIKLSETGLKKIWAAIKSNIPNQKNIDEIQVYINDHAYDSAHIKAINKSTTSKILNRKKGVDEKSIEKLFIIFDLVILDEDCESVIETKPIQICEEERSNVLDPKISMGSSIDLSIFLGRNHELEEIEKWIINEKSRIVLVLPDLVEKLLTRNIAIH
jgi:hypothetical protein